MEKKFTNDTKKFQVVGKTVFLLEETGKFARGPNKELQPVVQNKVMFAVQGCSPTFSSEDAAYLAEKIAHLLNEELAKEQGTSVFRQKLLGDVVEDEDDN